MMWWMLTLLITTQTSRDFSGMYPYFYACHYGPSVSVTTNCRKRWDVDKDRDVDLFDYAELTVGRYGRAR